MTMPIQIECTERLRRIWAELLAQRALQPRPEKNDFDPLLNQVEGLLRRALGVQKKPADATRDE